MSKKWIIIVITGGFLLAATAIYYIFFRPAAKTGSAIDAIPSTAGVIVEISDPMKTLPGLFSENSWKMMDTVGFFSEFSKQYAFVDSLISTNEHTSELMRQSVLYVSAHPSKNGISYLYSLQFKGEATNQFIDQFIQKANKDAVIERIRASEGTVHKIRIGRSARNFHYVLKGNVFLCSMDFSLVESGLQQLKSHSGLAFEKGFATVRKLSASGEKITFYFRFDRFTELLQPYFESGTDDFWLLMKRFAGWTMLNAALQEDHARFNGVMLADSAAGFLRIFDQSPAIDPAADNFLPSGTLYYAAYSYNSTIPAGYGSFSGKDIDSRELLSEWIRSEVCFFITGDKTPEKKSHYAMFDTDDPEGFAAEFSADTLALMHNGYIVRNFSHARLFEALPFNVIPPSDSMVFTWIEDQLIFAPSRREIFAFIDKYVTRQLLKSQDFYVQYMENLPGKPVLSFFIDPSAGSHFQQELLTAETYALWQENPVWKFMPAAGMHISRRSSVYAVSGCILLLPAGGRDLAQLWQTELSAPCKVLPRIVPVAGIPSEMLLVQDSAGMLYCLSGDGRIRWKRLLDSDIRGAVHSVELYESAGGQQMIFSTSGMIYGLDPDGKSLPGFSGSTLDELMTPVAVFNYGNAQDYRIFRVRADASIQPFDRNFRPVDGWKLPRLPSELAHEPIHLKWEEKDHLFFLYRNGDIRVTDRQGQALLEIAGTGTVAEGAPVLALNSTMSASAWITSSSDGTVRISYFDTAKKPDFFAGAPGSQVFAFEDANGDGVREAWLSDGRKIMCIDKKGKALFAFDMVNPMGELPALLDISGKKVVMAVNHAEKKLYLLNSELSLMQGFPVDCEGHGIIIDVNGDKKPELLVSGFPNKVVAYTLDI